MAFETGAISLEAIRDFLGRSGAETLDSARDYVHANSPSYNIPSALVSTGEVAFSDFRGITLATPSPTASPTPAPTNSPTPSPTPAPVTPPPTPSPTPAPVVSTPSPTNSPTPSPTPNPTPSPTPAPVTPSPTPNPTPAPVVSTPSPTNSPTPSPTNSPTPSPTPAPVTPPPTPAPTPAPTASPTPQPVTPPPTPSPTPAPVTPPPTPAPTSPPTPAPVAAAGTIARTDGSGVGLGTQTHAGGNSWNSYIVANGNWTLTSTNTGALTIDGASSGTAQSAADEFETDYICSSSGGTSTLQLRVAGVLVDSVTVRCTHALFASTSGNGAAISKTQSPGIGNVFNSYIIASHSWTITSSNTSIVDFDGDSSLSGAAQSQSDEYEIGIGCVAGGTATVSFRVLGILEDSLTVTCS